MYTLTLVGNNSSGAGVRQTDTMDGQTLRYCRFIRHIFLRFKHIHALSYAVKTPLTWKL